MNQIELLAPAGAMDKLIAAVNAGADAVYLGGNRFGARRSAGNFDNQELIKAVQFCHERHVKVYVTVNTLIKQNEFKDVLAYIDFLYMSDVDAVILQDIGLLHAIKEAYPDLQCHASTQMTFHNKAGVQQAKDMGFSRVVLSREMSYHDIRDIAQSVDIELEVFVHGALCVSYSGQCLMSAMIGGRSGNRGACAQPCRKKYQLIETQGTFPLVSRVGDYLLSPRDLMTIDSLNELLVLPKMSLKIEGRMKSADYVYTVVKNYKDAINETYHSSQKDQLARVFNRDFTKGYTFGKDYQGFMNQLQPSSYGTKLGKVISCKNGMIECLLTDDLAKGDEIQIRSLSSNVGARADIIYLKDVKVNEATKGDCVKIPFKHMAKPDDIVYKTYDTAHALHAEKSASVAIKKHGLHLLIEIKGNAPAKLTAWCQEKMFEIRSQIIPETAIKVPLLKDRVAEQLHKVGGTPFFVESLSIDLDEGLSFPVSQINTMRRELLEKILESFRTRYPLRVLNKRTLEPPTVNTDVSKIGIYVSDSMEVALEIEPLTSDNAIIAIDHWRDFSQQKDICVKKQFALKFPLILSQDEFDAFEALLSWYYQETQGKGWVILSHVADLFWLKRYPFESWYVDASANVYNDWALGYFYQKGAQGVIVSNELSYHELEALSVDYGVMYFGRIPLMVSEYCPIGGTLDKKHQCQRCKKGQFKLLDDYKASYLLKCDAHQCRVTLYSEAALDLSSWHDKPFDRLMKVDLSMMTSEEAQGVVKAFENRKPIRISTIPVVKTLRDKGVE